MGSLVPGTCQPDVDPPGRHLGVFLLADEVNLSGADVGVAGKLPYFVHRRPVADRVVDGRFARSDATPRPPSRDGSMPAPGNIS